MTWQSSHAPSRRYTRAVEFNLFKSNRSIENRQFSDESQYVSKGNNAQFIVHLLLAYSFVFLYVLSLRDRELPIDAIDSPHES